MSFRKSTMLDNDRCDQPLIALVALGSNLNSHFGTAEQNVRLALGRLAELSMQTPLMSSLWQTDPLDCPSDAAPFINAVVALVPEAGLSALDFLRLLQNFEEDFGRQRDGSINASRPLDLDLLTWGQQRVDHPQLTLPHPRAHLRRFVLKPLAQIAPDYRLPGQIATVQELLENLPAQGKLLELTS